MNDKPILYVDFDGTLVDTNAAITDLYNEDFKFYKNYYPVKAEDIDTYDFEECTCANKDYINTYFNLPRFLKSSNLCHGQRLLCINYLNFII